MSFLKKIFKPKAKLSRKEYIVELICTVLSCWLLSLATALILDSQFTIRIGTVTVVWQTLATIIVITLLTRRWWITPLCIVSLVPLFLFVLYLMGDFTAFFKAVSSFIKWWTGGMAVGSKWYADKSYYIIHTLMNIGVPIIYFAIARITKRAWISVIIALTFVASNFAFGYTKYSIITVPILVVAIFPLIAVEKFQRVKRPDGNEVFGVKGKKWLMMTVSTGVAIVIAASSLWVISNTKGSVRTGFFTDVISDLQTVTNGYTVEQKRAKITLYDLGLAKNTEFVGGNLQKVKSSIIASTNLTEPTRVKITAFDTFNGKNWITDFEKVYRINSMFWEDKQNKYLSAPLIGDEKFEEEIKKFVKREKVTITTNVNTHFLPTVGQVLSFEELTESINPVSFDSRGRLISFYGQPKNYSYTTESLIYDTSSPMSEAKMNELLGKFTFIEDPNYDKESDFYKHYTEPLYPELPKSIASTVKRFSNAAYNEYQKAYMVSALLSSKAFAYVEKPGKFEKEDNILEKLFATRKGHCVYYSTAMVAIMREIGIPSRMAVGFVTVPGKGKTQVIDTSKPYAWVECYMPNVGWVSFDPSPQNSLSIGGFLTDSFLAGLGDLGEGDTPKEEKKEVSGTNLEWSTELTKKLPFIILISVASFIFLVIILYTLLSQGFYKLKRVRKRFKSTEKQAKFYYADILRQFRVLGFRVNKGDTIREKSDMLSRAYVPDYAQTVNIAIESINALFNKGKIPDKEQIAEIKKAKKLLNNAMRGKIEESDVLKPEYFDSLKAAVAVLEGLYYGGRKPNDKQIEAIATARDSLEVLIKRNNNIFMYTLKRRLLLPIFTFKTIKK